MMTRKIEPVVRKTTLKGQGNDFAYWQTRSYTERLAVLEEIRQEFYVWQQSLTEGGSDVQPGFGFKRVYRIVKR